MNDNLLLELIVTDLRRICNGYNSTAGSSKMADRFCQEVLKKKEQLGRDSLPEYINKILEDVCRCLSNEKDNQKRAETALMYSTLLQNFIIKKGSLDHDQQ